MCLVDFGTGKKGVLGLSASIGGIGRVLEERLSFVQYVVNPIRSTADFLLVTLLSLS